MINWLPPELVANFHFLRPMWLLAMIPALLLFILLKILQSRQTPWQRSIEPALLPYLLDKSSGAKQQYPLYVLLTIWLLAALAMAGPVWQQIPVPVQEREDALVVVMDLSSSMLSTDVSPDRITRARRKLVDILNNRRDEGLTALVVYAGDAHAVTPLTDDVETINNLVSALDPGIMPVLGSNPVTGVELALELLQNGSLIQAQILLITDGINPADIDAIESVMSGTRHSMSILGVGTPDGAPIPLENGGFLRDNNNAIVIPRLERESLLSLASATQGRYADAVLSDEDIDYLLDASIFEQNENLRETERQFDSWYEVGPWFLLLILPLASLAFRRGWLLSICLIAMVLPPRQALALEWRDLWLTQDQQASDAFTLNGFERAAERFNDPAWRAAANYRIGDYELAVRDLALLDDPESHYNRGNALARLNRLEEALEAYDQTLEQVPDHEDALHNRELVQNLLEQQQEQQERQRESSEGEQQQQNQQQQDQEEEEQSSEDNNEQSDQEQNQQQNQQNQQEQENEQDQQNQDGEPQEDESEEGEQQEPEQPPELSEIPEGTEQLAAEEEQSMQQWLNRIPDNPAELLRNKFEYQSQRRLIQQLQNPGLINQQADRQTW